MDVSGEAGAAEEPVVEEALLIGLVVTPKKASKGSLSTEIWNF